MSTPEPSPESTPPLDELYDGYQALGEVLIPRQEHTATSSYELGYLDAWADAMHHAAWVHEGAPLQVKDCFPLLHGKKIRRKAAEALMARREATATLSQAVPADG